MKKLQGFPNEYLYVLPSDILRNFSFSKVIPQLYITDIGFYPNAKDHYVHRNQGTDEWILIFCTHGQGHVASKTKSFHIERGSMVLLPPHQEHTYYSSEDYPWDIFWVHFSGTLVSEYLPHDMLNKPSIIIQNRTNPKDMDMLMSQFWQMIQTFSSGFSYAAVFYASQMLGTTLAYILFQTSSVSNQLGLGNEHITKAVQYIYDHLEDKISLNDITRELGISASYLSRIFRQTIGMSVNQFIIDIKTKQASHYLLDSTLSIEQIAHHLGYTDQYYFSRLFKQKFGISPQKYRKQKINRSKNIGTK